MRCLMPLVVAFCLVQPLTGHSQNDTPTPATRDLTAGAVQLKTAPRAVTTVQKAKAVRRKNYLGTSTLLSSGSDDPRYSCDYGRDGKPTSCWCNWSQDAADCAAFTLTNPCGNDACWTSDVPGEYGCDCQD